MKKFFMTSLVLTSLIWPASAHAGDYLGSAVEATMMPAKFALVYDQCVNAGFIRNDGATAEVKLRTLIENAKRAQDPYRPKDVTGVQVAEAETTGLEALKKALGEHPVALDKEKCEGLEKQWPEISKFYHLE